MTNLYAKVTKIQLLQDTLEEKFAQNKFVPFNPVDKYTIAIVTDKSTGNTFRILKGAPQVSSHTHPSLCTVT